MATGIMILGSAGAGKTTLGKLVAEELGFTFVDIDEYIWRKDTEKPFTVMYSKEEKISRLMDAISDTDHFVMAGSMNSFHEHFDPFFELVVHLHADAQLRVERVHRRELELFGDRILEGGDMYEEHQKFLEGVAGYDYGIGSSTLQKHQSWMDSLRCKVIRLDGACAPGENVKTIVDEYGMVNQNNNLSDKKIVLAADEKARKISNILTCIISGILLLLNILLLFVKPSLAIISFPCSIIFMVSLFNYINRKIEIENYIIKKCNLFDKKKEIGHISEITSFAEDDAYVTVFNKDEKIFTFLIHGREDNIKFHEYLKSNYKCSICVIGTQPLGFGLVILGIAFILSSLLEFICTELSSDIRFWLFFGVVLLFVGLNEVIKKLQITDEQINYKRWYVNKRISLSDLSKIEYERSNPRSNLQTVIGFKGNSRVFKVCNFTPGQVKLLKNMANKYGVRMTRKR